MDNKIIALFAVVVIVVAGAAAGIMLTQNNGSNNNGGTEISDTVVIYGNANNDSYIDDKDVEYVQDVLDGKYAWDRSTNPYADANNDGRITAADIDQIKMIINNEKGYIWYQNYFNEPQKISYPLENRNIAVTYWQQAEAVAILGQWDNVKVANRYVTDIKGNQYDCTNVKPVGTTGSSTKSVDTEGVQTMINEKINLIIATPTTGVKEGCEKVVVDGVKADAIYLWHMGNSSIPTILTMGIMFNVEEKAMNYAKFCYGLIDKINDRMQGKEKVDIVVSTMYANQSDRSDITICSGVGREGTCTVLQYLGNVYNNWKGINDYGMASYQQDWFLNPENQFDVNFIVFSSVDQFTLSQEDFNKRFEMFTEYFKNTKAYNNHGIMGAPYIFAGYSSYSMLMYAAYMIYPDLFTLEEAQQTLQTWFDSFTVAHVNVKDDAVVFYTGDKYQTRY